MEASAHDADVTAALAVDAALARLEESVGDAEFVAELLGDFLDALPAQLAALSGALAAGDGKQVHRIAHTLKSNAATFGADELADACRELEHAARGGVATPELVAAVEGQASRALPALAAARERLLA